VQPEPFLKTQTPEAWNRKGCWNYTGATDVWISSGRGGGPCCHLRYRGGDPPFPGA